MSQVFDDMEHLIGYGTGPKSWTIDNDLWAVSI